MTEEATVINNAHQSEFIPVHIVHDFESDMSFPNVILKRTRCTLLRSDRTVIADNDSKDTEYLN